MEIYQVGADGRLRKKKKQTNEIIAPIKSSAKKTSTKTESKKTTTTKETKYSDFRSSRAELEKNRLVKQYSSRNPLDYMQKSDAESELKKMGYSDDELKKLRKDYRKNKDGVDLVRSGSFGRDDIGAVEKGVLGIGGTGLHIARNLVEGAILQPLEGGADLIRYGVAGILDGVGADKTAQTWRDVAQEDDMQKLLSFSDDYFERNSMLGNDTQGFVQAIGQVFGLKGLASMLGKAGVGAKGISTAITGTNFVTSAGSGMTDAYKSGATDKEATKYGLMQGGIDAGTELLSGGLGKGTKALGLSYGVGEADDLIAKTLTKNMKNQTAKNFMQGLIKSFGEGGEEALAGYLSAHAQKGTFRSEDDFDDIMKDQQIGKQFMTGMLVSNVAQVGSVAKASKQGVDYVSGYTQNEQSVVDRIANDQIQEAEKDGKKLTIKEKNKIKENVETMLQRGEIDIDTIESTLGGETYKAHENLVKESEEFETLRNKKQGDMTDIEQDRLKELKAKNTEKAYAKQIEESKLKLSDEVRLATQNDMFLRESYAERSRRGEQFTVSEDQMKKYSEKEREIVQKAIDYGEMNNTRKAHEFVDLVAKLSADKGVSFDFTNNERLKNSGFALEGKTINGFKSGNNIVINLESNNRFETVVGHEITHVLEGSKELYKALQDNVIEYAKQKGVYDSMYKEIVHLYRNQFQNETLQKRKALYDSEITADLVGLYIFSDVDFVRNLSTKNRNVFQKVYDEIKYLLKSVTSGSDAEKQLLKAKKIFEDVYRDTKNNTSEKTQLSLEDIANMNEKSYNHHGWAKVNDVLSDTELADFQSKVGERKRLDGEWLYNLGKGKQMYAVGVDGVNNTLVISDGNYENPSIEKVYHIGLNNETDIEVLRDEIYKREKDSERTLSSDVITNLFADEPIGAYRIEDFFDYQTMREEYEGTKGKRNTRNSQNVQNRGRSNPKTQYSVNDTKTPNDGVFFDEKTQFSVSDNKGRTLTKEQQEKFKDSKVRDENGKLLTMYHGTPNGDYTIFRDGTYFTQNKEYADVYQSQGASSLGYKKTANNPKTYEVYLDIKKPFDTRNPKERAIFENEYFGQWGMGTPLMESGLPDWMDGEDLREFLEEKGYDYDGLILDEGGVGGYGDEVKSRGYSYVVFNPNQVKNVDNKKPTDTADIRYSISDNGKMIDNNGKEVTLETSDVGTHGTLMAIRNINEGELRGMLELDGIPVPSIAITNPNIVDHSNFGRISVLFDKETINPTNKKNEVYDRDIWSSRFPTVEYEIDTKKASELNDRGYRVSDIAYFNPVTFYPDNLEDSLRREKGEQGLIESGKNDYGLKNLYLAETSESVNIVTAERTIETPKGEAEQYSYMLQHMANEIAEVTKMSGKDWFEKYGEKFNEVEKAYWKQEVPTLTEEDLQQIVESRKPIKLVGIAKKIQQYSETGGKVVEQYQDHEATKQEIDNRINKTEYEAWLRDLYKGIEKSKGIRNNVDLFTPSGNRRSFKALHDSYTLENIVKNMTKGKTQGSEKALFGISAGAISSQMATRYKSISDIKKDEGRISANADEQVKPLTDRLKNGIDSLRDYYNGGAYNFYDSSTGAVFEFSQKKLTESNFRRILSEYPFEVDKIPSETLQEIIDSLNALKDIPTDYFEAKPQRAVGLDEIQAIVVPNDIDAQLRKDLIDKGLHIIEYNPNVEGDRQRVVNQFDELKFSLSEKNKPIAPIKNGIYAEDIALEKPIAPIQSVETNNMMQTDHNGEVTEMVAPIGENVQKREVQGMDTLPLPQDNVKGVKIQKGVEVPKKQTNNEKGVEAPQRPTKNGKELRSWAETSTESEALGGAIKIEDLDQDLIHYEPISNKKTLENANNKLDSFDSYENAMTYFNSQMNAKKVDLVDLVMGERLLQEAIKRKDTKSAGELIQNISILGTELGQKVQALSIIQRLTPEGQLKVLQKIVNRGKMKGDKIFKDVELTDSMRKEILDAYNKDGSYDQDKLNSAIENVKQQLADQMDVTPMEKINAWRMLSMLGNPKTHGRNIISNATMYVVREAKNSVARTIETIAPIKNRTKTWKRASDDVKAFATQSTKEAESLFKGEHRGTQSTTLNDIKAKRKMFKTKVLQNVYGLNSDLLQNEDTFFKKPVYRRSLQEFLTANGIKTQEDIKKNAKLVEKGKQYAMEQCLLATFQQDSALAEWISSLEKRNALTQVAVGSVLPFKKTPINIAKTGLAYSPLGFAKTLAYDIPQVAKGKMEASQLIDNISQATTGTALMLTGYLLSSLGFLNGGGEDDKEGEYDYQLGEQSYSINIGGKSYSLSWLTPASMPLFIGANLNEVVSKGEDLNFDATVDALASTLDPMSEMSFLSSLDTVLSSYEKGMSKWAGVFENAGQSYVSQFVPTLLSQVAQVTDDTKRSTSASSDSNARMLEQTARKLMYKIPGLRQMLEPTIDIHGNEIKQNENVLIRGVESFIAPYNTKEYIADEVDNEIKRLYSQTGDNGLIPNVPSSKVQFKGANYKMSAEEYTNYKKTYGQTANNYLRKLFETSTYKNATIEDKNDMVNKVYDYARDVAHKEYLEKEGIQYTNTTENNVPVYKENNIKGAIDNDMTVGEYTLYSKNRGEYYISKLVGGFDEYEGYKDTLNSFASDKNAQGETIRNSLKNKKFAYINNLNVDFGAKILLWKQQYPSDDRYNVQIIEYLNDRQDISYQDMVDILTELDFKVSADGTVRW